MTTSTPLGSASLRPTLYTRMTRAFDLGESHEPVDTMAPLSSREVAPASGKGVLRNTSVLTRAAAVVGVLGAGPVASVSTAFAAQPMSLTPPPQRLMSPPGPGPAPNGLKFHTEGATVEAHKKLVVGMPSGLTAAQAAAVRTLQSVDLWSHPMTVGDHGDAVRRLKQGLAIVSPGLSKTDMFDSDTQTAVQSYQQSKGIPVNGKMDARTYGVLFHDLFWNHKMSLELIDPGVYAQLPSDIQVKVNTGSAGQGGQRISLVASDGTVFKQYPTSSGSSQFPTPKGNFQIQTITERPSWTPPHSAWAKKAHFTPPGPSNPVGNVKMNIVGAVFFHGVPPKEYGTIGYKAESHACMRMFQSDAWQLHHIIQVGTPVEIH